MFSITVANLRELISSDYYPLGIETRLNEVRTYGSPWLALVKFCIKVASLNLSRIHRILQYPTVKQKLVAIPSY